MSRRRPWVLALVLLLAGLAAAGTLLRRAVEPEAPLRPTRLFDQVFTHIKRFGVDSLAESEIYRRAANGLLGQLEDEYATLLPAGSEHGLTERADVGGLGLLIATRDGHVRVLSVLPGSPADLAGVAPGDQLLESGSVPLDAERRDRVLAALDGPAGTEVQLRARRPGVGLVTFTLKRAEPVETLVTRGIRLDDRVGYVAVRVLGPGASRAVRREVEALAREGLSGLVLDLRGASQGSLDEAVRLAGLFLEPGAKVLEVRGRGPDPRRYGDDDPQDRRLASLALVALVDSATADAAEAVAGALQDNDRALLMGEPTFGRGLTPETFALGERTTIRISTGRWYTPSGRPIQRDTATSDTLERRPKLPTTAGRTVYSGGGIVPDSLVARDTVPASQLAFLRALGPAWSAWRATVRSAAAAASTSLAPGQDPVVTTEERARLQAALEKDGVTMSPEVWEGGAPVVDRILADEMVRAAQGEDGLQRRRVLRDRLVLKAAALLRGATASSLVLGK